MKIIFYENRYGNFFDKLIRFKTASWKQRFNGSWKDLASHVEILFSDGMMFSTSPRENTTRFKKYDKYNPAWYEVELKCDYKTERKVRLWCTSQLGKKYDYLGILGFILPGLKDDPSRWFCSEVCFESLKQNTNVLIDFEYIDSAKVYPERFKLLIK